MSDNTNSYEAECSVLGSILINSELIQECDLQPREFNDKRHQLMMEYMYHLKENYPDKPVDLVLIGTVAGNNIHKIGGFEYLMKLSESVPSTSNFKYYHEVVREKAKLRDASDILRKQSENVGNAENSDEYINDAMQALEGLSANSNDAKEFVKMSDTLKGHEDVITKRQESKGVTGSKTASADLDELTGGWQKQDLIIIAARPSIGKSAYMLCDAERGQAPAAKYGTTRSAAAIFSIEMPAVKLSERMICNLGNLDGRKLKSGDLTETDWKNWASAMTRLDDYPIFIRDSVGITLQQIERSVSKLVKIYPDLIVYIDYLQLINPGKKFSQPHEGIAFVSKGLKAIARKYDIPIVALSAVGRDVEKRQDKRPLMSDLRESGSIESDADIVIFLYRDDYYDPNSNKKNIIELIVAKGRDIGTGLVEMVYIRSKSKFIDITKKEPKQEGEPVADPF